MNNTNTMKKKATTAAVLLLALALSMSACSNASQDPNNSGNSQGNNESVGSNNLPDNDGVMDPDTPSEGGSGNDTASETGDSGGDDEDKGSTGDDGSTEAILHGEGTYTGAIDSNSVEIRTDEGANAYRLTSELTSIIEELPAEAKVKFEYTEKVIDSENNVKQLWLQSIEEIK
ncbi:hypothetical protein [Paenibacillus chungangensis]|uniref:Lipoprotein n=1 Tax=Paenibacillus chungangensis TaxID=696535 RepID=A0ABW3HUJ1_9BACL